MIVLSVMLDLSFTLCEVSPLLYYKDLTCQPKKSMQRFLLHVRVNCCIFLF